MTLPNEIVNEIAQYAWGGGDISGNWREGSAIINLLKGDRWWKDFELNRDKKNFYPHRSFPDETWSEWYEDKLIIGPPRRRGDAELSWLDEDYLTMEEFDRHFHPWMKTWPDPHDWSWCTGPYRTELPYWAVKEYLENN